MRKNKKIGSFPLWHLPTIQIKVFQIKNESNAGKHLIIFFISFIISKFQIKEIEKNSCNTIARSNK